MKVKFIGTGSIGSPNTSASYLINDNILVDCGSGVVKQMLKFGIDFSKIKYIFITHLHGDHTFDIPFLLYQFDKSGVNTPITFIGPRKLEVKTRRLLKEAFTRYYKVIYNNLDINFIDASNYISLIDDINISSSNVIHGKLKPCYGYRFNKLFITGDAILEDNIIENIKISSNVIIDCSLVKHSDTHMGVDSICQLGNDNPSIKFYPSHVGINALDKLKKFKSINNNVIICKDGDTIEI